MNCDFEMIAALLLHGANPIAPIKTFISGHSGDKEIETRSALEQCVMHANDVPRSFVFLLRLNPNGCACVLSIQEPGISNFEHAYVRIFWTLLKTMKLGYPWLSLRSEHRYPYLSLLIPTYTELYQGYPGISYYKNLTLAYPQTTFLSRLLLGYAGISHRSGYPGISWYKSGFGRVSFFQMNCF